MGFEVFTAYGVAARGEATLRASGYLFLSKALLQRIGVEGADEQLVLLYDKAAAKLGIRRPQEGDPTEALRSLSNEPSGAAVNVVPLLKFYGIARPKQKLRLETTYEGGFLVVDMNPALLQGLLE